MKSNIENFYILAAARLKEIRESTGLSQKDFAEMFSVNQTTYCRYESGEIKNMPNDLIQLISLKYDINPAWLAGFEYVEKYMLPADSHPKRVPIMSTENAQQNIEGYEFVPDDIGADFCFRIKGDSMINARILDGDIVFIHKQSDIKSGEIAAVIIDNEELTLKRVYLTNGTIILRSENPNYPDRVFNKKERRQASIIGKAIRFISEVK